MTKEDVQLKAFQIIAAAGDALSCYYDAAKNFKRSDLEETKQKIKEGDEALTKAHLVQTELIRAEVNGEDIPSSLILTHSQDHLLQAMTWEKIARLLIDE